MARVPRIDVGDCIYHVINRASQRATIFKSPKDYQEFEALLYEIKETFDMRILGYALMPNHWHLLLHPRKDKDLSKAMHWLTSTHARRHNTRKGTIGYGSLYQGRYKSSLIKDQKHLLMVLKYIERNPVRAELCAHARDWQWGSACKRAHKHPLLAKLPINLPHDYEQWVNTAESAEVLKTIRQSIHKGVPYQGV